MKPTRSQSLVAVLIIVLFVLFVAVGFRANQQALKTSSNAQTANSSVNPGGAGGVSPSANTGAQQRTPSGSSTTGGNVDLSCKTDADCPAKVQQMCSLSPGKCPSDLLTQCLSGICAIWQKGQPAPTAGKTQPTPSSGLISVIPTQSGGTNEKPVSCSTKSKGDVNCDGKIDLIDFNIWLSEFNSDAPPLNADINGDGKVNLTDFEIWRVEFTKE